MVLLFAAWYYLENGKLLGNNTGTLIPNIRYNSNGWWFVDEYGTVDFSRSGFVTNVNGTWMCQNGRIDFSYQGLMARDGSHWAVTDGKVNTGYTGFVRYEGIDYYVKNGKLTNTIGLVNLNCKWKIAPNSYITYSGWYYMENGVRWYKSSYTLATNSNGTWLVNTDGKIYFEYSGLIIQGERVMKITNGKFDQTYTGVYTDRVNPNNNKYVYFVNGEIASTYTGYVTQGGKIYYVVNGYVTP